MTTERKQGHTPGQWNDYGGLGIMADGKRIADVFSSAVGDKEARANARLIAATPELLEAAKASLEQLLFAESLLNSMKGVPDNVKSPLLDAISKLRAILSKAEA